MIKHSDGSSSLHRVGPGPRGEDGETERSRGGLDLGLVRALLGGARTKPKPLDEVARRCTDQDCAVAGGAKLLLARRKMIADDPGNFPEICIACAERNVKPRRLGDPVWIKTLAQAQLI